MILCFAIHLKVEAEQFSGNTFARIEEHERAHTACSYPNLRNFPSVPTKLGTFLFGTRLTFIDRDPHWYTRRVEEAIHIRFHPNIINRYSGIEIPDAWMPTIKKRNSGPFTKRTSRGTIPSSWNNNEDRNATITGNERATYSET